MRSFATAEAGPAQASVKALGDSAIVAGLVAPIPMGDLLIFFLLLDQLEF